MHCRFAIRKTGDDIEIIPLCEGYPSIFDRDISGAQIFDIMGYAHEVAMLEALGRYLDVKSPRSHSFCRAS